MYNWVMIRIRVRIIKVKIIILKCKTLPPAIKVVFLVIYINTLEYHFNLFSQWAETHSRRGESDWSSPFEFNV